MIGYQNGRLAPTPRFGEPDPIAFPPHNIEVEEAILGAILLDSGVLDLPDVARLKLDDFFRARHQVIFAAMRHLHDQGVPVEPIGLGAELERRGEWQGAEDDIGISDLMCRAVTAANAPYHAQLLRRISVNRWTIERMEETIRDARSNDYTRDELLARAAGRIESIDGFEDIDEVDEVSIKDWPVAPDPAIWHGVAGELSRLIEPHTEADPLAILGQFLAAFGNIVGRHCYYQVEATRHFCNLFLAIVGSTARGRKGTSWNRVRALMNGLCELWCSTRIFDSGLTTGEGLIWQIRDPITVRQKKAKRPLIGGDGYEDVEMDPGVDDKRALFVENEFGGMLAKASREGNSLNMVLRNMWDGIPLRSDSKNLPAVCRRPHGSVIGHVTYRELLLRLNSTDTSNGFANRFLWLCVRRSKCLPRGGQIGEVNFTQVHCRLKEAMKFATFATDQQMRFDSEAGDMWDEVYPRLTAERSGVVGDITSRADPQTIRLAMIYAVLDCSSWIQVEHLRAALAFWRCCEASAQYIFGDFMGDPVSDRILRGLERAGAGGMTKTELSRKLFGGKRTREVSSALSQLVQSGMVALQKTATGGRPREVLVFVPEAERAAQFNNHGKGVAQKGPKGEKGGSVDASPF